MQVQRKHKIELLAQDSNRSFRISFRRGGKRLFYASVRRGLDAQRRVRDRCAASNTAARLVRLGSGSLRVTTGGH